jgi:mono/diheme cytochrome c family protein
LVTLALALLAAAPVVARGQAAPRREAEAIEFFEKKIRPLLAENCFNCHSANTNSRGGLRVDDRNGLLQGGGRGPAVVPGRPDDSLLLRAVRKTTQLKMPPNKQLAPEQIADLTQWIRDGAAWTKVELPHSLGKQPARYARLRKEHWAWQPLRAVKPPAVSDTAWAVTDIDRFILAPLEEKGLKPVHDADRLHLLRRATFDLTGLPPTPAEIDAFLKDRSPDAYERVVNRLLASPHYGERWGRHWLDVARYGESTGSARNLPYPHAWRYRDYVINAFNGDRPYDQFLREQIAGDLLSAGSPSEREQQLVATGFLALGVRDVNQRFKVRFVMDNVDEQIDTVSRAVLGLTASCARCHDHKFDPIPTTDYYALAGIFTSTDLCAGLRNKMGGGGLDYYDSAMLLQLRPGDSRPDSQTAEQIALAKKAVVEARKEFQTLVGTARGKSLGPDGRPLQMVARQKMVKLEMALLALTDPAVQGPVALGVRDAKSVGDTPIRIRGEAEQHGPVVARGFLSLLDVPDAPKINSEQSGRLELAQWLTSPRNPLPSRVMVNRVWQHLFGQGLVRSVDNFGATGDVPSHPELLDYLAARFVRDGWSVKRLVRTLVLSRAYQLSSEAPAAHLALDPANRLVWRHSPRRLDAEEIRDATLAAAGTLDLSRPEGSPAQELKVIELPNNSPLAGRLQDAADKSLHRSVYLPLVRGLTPRSLEVFDFAEQGLVTGSRDTTTVAPQALYLLNDPFVRRQALVLTQRLLSQADLDDKGRFGLVYRLALGRSPTAKEIDRANAYVADYEAAARRELPEDALPPIDPHVAAWASFCQALLASAEFRYVQ